MRDAKARQGAGFWFNVQKWPMPEPGDASLPKKPHHDSHGHQGGRKSTSTTECRKKEAIGDTVPDVSQSLSYSSLSVVQVVTFPNFLDQ